MKQEMQLFDSTENPSPNSMKLCEALKTIPPTSVETQRAFSAAGLLAKKLRTRLSDKMPSLQGGTLNSRRAGSPLARLAKGEKRWEAPDHPQGILPQNWVEAELNHSVTSMVLKATANDRRHLALCNDEFRGP
ncbi:cullin-4A [Trichonephila clavipes]|uniref:Cullin-4A n=1 Tax=Trichonephila clavipes TaxID=2585209 RepID=A0A8X6RJT7_TRICX|nr:cullin-4A [Trichonephila clavipes]